MLGGNMAYSFNFNGLKWYRSDIQWSFGLPGGIEFWTKKMTGQFAEDVKRAFERWQSVAQINFSEVPYDVMETVEEATPGPHPIEPPYIAIGWRDFGPIGLAQIIGKGGPGSWVEIGIDPTAGWHRDQNGRLVAKDGTSFYFLVLHEIGHALGLGHHTGDPSIMGSGPSERVGPTDLTDYDIAAIQRLYGARKLFSNDADKVNFGRLSEEKKISIKGGVDLYDAKDGNDVVTLVPTGTILAGSRKFEARKFKAGGDNDHVTGSAGSDSISGGGGDDTIIGGAGNDVFYGVGNPLNSREVETGHNRITGGTDSDTVIWSGRYEEYDKTLSVSFRDFFMGKGLQVTISSRFGDASDTLTDRIEHLRFARDEVPYEKLQAIAGFKWALESATDFLETALKYIEAGGVKVPSSYKTGIEWIKTIRSIVADGIDAAGAPNPYRALFIEANVLFVKSLKLYTDGAVSGSSKYTSKYYSALEKLVRLNAGETYDILMQSTLPLSEAFGQKFGDFWYGVTSEVDPVDLKGKPSKPFVPSVPKMNFNDGTDGNDSITITLRSLSFKFQGYNTLSNTGDGNDRVVGSSAADYVLAGAGNDRVKGGGGHDRLVGGAGGDELWGGSGKDAFVFDISPAANAGVDKLPDFSVKDDTINLDDGAFVGLSRGKLAGSAFVTGAVAKDTSDRLIYDKARGYLYYDPDGTGAEPQFPFAKLKAGLALKASDFLVI